MAAAAIAVWRDTRMSALTLARDGAVPRRTVYVLGCVSSYRDVLGVVSAEIQVRYAGLPPTIGTADTFGTSYGCLSRT